MSIGDRNFPYGNLRTKSGEELGEGQRQQRASFAQRGRRRAHAAGGQRGRTQRRRAQQLHHGHGHGERKLRQRQLAHDVAGRAQSVPRAAQRAHRQHFAPHAHWRHAAPGHCSSPSHLHPDSHSTTWSLCSPLFSTQLSLRLHGRLIVQCKFLCHVSFYS